MENKKIILQAFEGARVDFEKGIKADLQTLTSDAAVISEQFLSIYDELPPDADKKTAMLDYFSWFAIRYLAAMIQLKPSEHSMNLAVELQGFISQCLVEAMREPDHALQTLEDAAGKVGGLFEDFVDFLGDER